MVRRFALGIEYDGTAYSGWEAQRYGLGIQAVVEKALSQIAAGPIKTVCAGRTDAGVHATGQVVHFNTDALRPDHAWVLGSNTHLPHNVRIRWAHPVPNTFHARYSAFKRRYRYVFFMGRVPSALLHGRVSWSRRELNVARMAGAAKRLHGEHDFNAFRSSRCQAPRSIRRVHRIHVWRRGQFLGFDITANAFLHHMVRNIAGVLAAIGSGDAAPEWIDELLQSGDRTQAGVTAPAAGLYLFQVKYPPAFGLPTSVSEFRHWLVVPA